MALYILNCSVDTCDFNSNYISEDLTINDQESLIEIIVEKVLGYDDVIPENEDCDLENIVTLKKIIVVDFFILPSFNSSLNEFEKEQVLGNRFLNEFNLLKTYFEIHSPPPEV